MDSVGLLCSNRGGIAQNSHRMRRCHPLGHTFDLSVLAMRCVAHVMHDLKCICTFYAAFYFLSKCTCACPKKKEDHMYINQIFEGFELFAARGQGGASRKLPAYSQIQGAGEVCK